MLKKISVIFLFISSLACNDKPQKPDNLISEKKMEALLYDLYVINSAKGVNRKLLEKKGVVPETYILTKHNVDSLQFAESNNYYAFDTETYSEIVENVKARLEKEKRAYEAMHAAEGLAAKKRRDSIKEANKLSVKIKDSISENIKDIN